VVSEGAGTTDGAATRYGGTWKTRRLTAALLAAVVVVLAAVIGASGASAEPASGSSASYIVTFAAGVDGAQQTADIAAANASDVSAIPQLRRHAIYATDVAAADLAASADVVRVEADATRSVQAAPSDSDYSQQWSLPAIGWDQVFGSVSPAGTSTVAVLDTGVDASHPDLAGQLVPGTSVLDPTSDGTTDPNGHGTWMAGIVAASTDNGMDCRHRICRRSRDAGDGAGADGTGSDSDIISGVLYAADHGADVILMSFSNPGYSDALQAAIDYAWSRGAVVWRRPGTTDLDRDLPAGDRGVVGVSSTNFMDSLDLSSNYGADTFLAAPGAGIETTAAGGGYETISGTSAAAAEVAGAAALLKANDSSASNGTIVGRLARNADAAGTSDQTGNGRLNLGRAIADKSVAPVEPAGSPPVGAGGPFVGPYTISAASVNSATLDGGSTTTVVAGGTISAAVTVTSQNNNANNRVGSIGWRIATTAPGAVACVDVTDVQNTTLTRTFNITAPASNGTYNAYFIAYSDNACTANASSTLTLTNGVVVAPATPAPTTTSISPTSRFVGDGAFTLTVNGTNFVSSSVVRWAGLDRTTTFVSSTQLTAAIPATDLATTGSKAITVFNPAPGGGTSNSQTFTVNANPVPTTTSIAPATRTAGGGAFTLTVDGTNFVGNSVVRVNGATSPTTFVSSTELAAHSCHRHGCHGYAQHHRL
jgi:hypothetical protein